MSIEKNKKYIVLSENVYIHHSDYKASITKRWVLKINKRTFSFSDNEKTIMSSFQKSVSPKIFSSEKDIAKAKEFIAAKTDYQLVEYNEKMHSLDALNNDSITENDMVIYHGHDKMKVFNNRLFRNIVFKICVNKIDRCVNKLCFNSEYDIISRETYEKLIIERQKEKEFDRIVRDQNEKIFLEKEKKRLAVA